MIALASCSVSEAGSSQSESNKTDGTNNAAQNTDFKYGKIDIPGKDGALCGAPIYIAYENGYFAEEGFDVNLISADFETRKIGLNNGTIPIVNGDFQFFPSIENGINVKVVDGLHDEPTNDLDDENTRAVFELLKNFAGEGHTVIAVTHDSTAADFADTVHLSKRRGTNVKLRRGNINDLREIASIESICFPPEQAAKEEQLRGRLEKYPQHFLVLCDNSGKLISFINGFVTDIPDLTDEMYENADMHNEKGAWQMIFGLNTLPEYRGRGHAKTLMNEFLSIARTEGRRGAVLTCKESLTGFYEQFGFVNEGISEGSVIGGVKWYQMRRSF